MIATTLLSLLILITTTAVRSCHFVGLIASCHMNIGGIPMEVSARINHCHTPVDVTFLVQGEATQNTQHSIQPNSTLLSNESPMLWRYTYVTTNQPESQELPGFGKRILIHLVAHNVARHDPYSGYLSNKLNLKVQFLLDGQTNEALTFIDDAVWIPHFDDCLFAHQGEAVAKITLGCVSVLVALVLMGIGAYWWHRRKGRSDDELGLVHHMERGRPNEPHWQPEINTVLYVVPRRPEDPDSTGDRPDVLVSTATGLQKANSEPPPPLSAPGDGVHLLKDAPGKIAADSEHHLPDTSRQLESPSSSLSEASDVSLPAFPPESVSPSDVPSDRFLGAIPKRRIASSDNSSERTSSQCSKVSSSSSSFVSR